MVVFQHKLPDPSRFGLRNQVGHGTAKGVPDQGHFFEIEGAEKAEHVRAHQLQ